MNSKSLRVLHSPLSSLRPLRCRAGMINPACTSAKPSLSPLHLTPPPCLTAPRPSISRSQTHLIWGVIAGADLWQGVERSDCCAPLSAEDEIEENGAQETPRCYSRLPRLIPCSKHTTVPTTGKPGMALPV